MIRNMKLGLLTAVAIGCYGIEFAPAVPIGGVTVTDNSPIDFNAAAGAAILTDGIIDDNNWLASPQASLGWHDPNWNIDSSLSSDTGVPQPQITFNLGGTYFVNSVTVSYTIDHIAGDETRNLRAPDSMIATFSTNGVGGPFSNSVSQMSWDDSDDSGDSISPGEGILRSLTTNLGDNAANSVRVEFFTDAEWLFISEISFDGQLVPEPGSFGLLTLGTLIALSSRRRSERQ